MNGRIRHGLAGESATNREENAAENSVLSIVVSRLLIFSVFHPVSLFFFFSSWQARREEQRENENALINPDSVYRRRRGDVPTRKRRSFRHRVARARGA